VTPEFPSDNPELWRVRAPTADRCGGPSREPEPEVLVADFDDADFAIVDEQAPPPAPAAEDPFQRFMHTLVQVSMAAGAPARIVALLPAMMGAARLDAHALDTPTADALVLANLLARSDSGAVTRSESFVANAQAWRAIMLGENTDCAVSSMLDEWSAHIVSSLAATPGRSEILRRELRSHGIAAFGLIEAA
jgi:hypothetical protein